MDPVKDTQRDTLFLENRFFILKKINSYSGAKSICGMMDVILDLFSCRKTYGTMLIVNTIEISKNSRMSDIYICLLE